MEFESNGKTIVRVIPMVKIFLQYPYSDGSGYNNMKVILTREEAFQLMKGIAEAEKLPVRDAKGKFARKEE